MQKELKMGTMDSKKLRNDLKYGDVSRIAEAFNVSRTTIYNVINGVFENEPIFMKIKEVAKARREQREKKLTELSKLLAHENN